MHAAVSLPTRNANDNNNNTNFYSGLTLQRFCCNNNNNNNDNNIIFIQVKLVQLQCAVINQGPVKPNYSRK